LVRSWVIPMQNFPYRYKDIPEEILKTDVIQSIIHDPEIWIKSLNRPDKDYDSVPDFMKQNVEFQKLAVFKLANSFGSILPAFGSINGTFMDKFLNKEKGFTDHPKWLTELPGYYNSRLKMWVSLLFYFNHVDLKDTTGEDSADGTATSVELENRWINRMRKDLGEFFNNSDFQSTLANWREKLALKREKRDKFIRIMTKGLTPEEQESVNDRVREYQQENAKQDEQVRFNSLYSSVFNDNYIGRIGL